VKITITSYDQAAAILARIEQQGKEISARLREFPRLPNGLMPDHVRATPEWQAAHDASVANFSALRAVNSLIMRHYKKEHRAATIARRQAKMQAAAN